MALSSLAGGPQRRIRPRMAPHWQYPGAVSRPNAPENRMQSESMKPSVRTRSLAFAATLVATLALLLAALVVIDHAIDSRVIETVTGQLPSSASGEIARQLASVQNETLSFRLGLLAASGAALLVLALAIAWRVSRRLEAPLELLRDAAWEMAAGRSASLALPQGGHTHEVALALAAVGSRLASSEAAARWLDVTLDSMADSVFVTAPDGSIRRANAAAARLTGWSAEELRELNLTTLVADQDRGEFDIAGASSGMRELTFVTRAGQTIPVSLSGSRIADEDPNLRGCVFVAHDITDRKRAERRIRYLARYDTLTKVPNRMQFQHSLQQAMARARRAGRGVALLYLDLDQFKEINDTFGHAAGDRTLEILSERLIGRIPKETMLGRLAGDEFGLFVENLPREEDNRAMLGALARTLLDQLGRPFHIGNQEILITASVGIALCPQDADNVVDLIRDADAAMYHSKQNGGNSFSFYAPDMSAIAVERLMLKSKLRRAIERDELVMLYQPKVDLKEGRIVGAEALLRWRLPDHGDIPPAQFIPLAEESDLITAIGEWVLKRVCRDYRRWQDHVPQPGRVSINLSLKQLRQAEFIPNCRSVFSDFGVSPVNFELEITETTLMTDARRMVGLLDELRGMGLHLSIDDFGTGYSSLAALQQFPVGTLKIDQSFVQHAADSRDDATLVRTIVEMGRNLELEVVAEGIETSRQLAHLRELGCHLGQGRVFGEPMAADALLAVLLAQARGEKHFAALFA
jgi:diguanylate cyclase (GGDEF)-like protein/PAS domain S-box-containing protein